MLSQRTLVPWNDGGAQPAPQTSLHDPTSVSPEYESQAPPIEDEDEEAARFFRQLSFEDVLDELNARFLVNLPDAEKGTVRLYFQTESAHWFYEDYLRPLNPVLPQLSQKRFSELLIEANPMYQGHISDYEQAWIDYVDYKKMVPCCGGILINRAGDQVLMVRGYKSNAWWGFPRGKINDIESPEACAIREVKEETGYDMTDLLDPDEFIETQFNGQDVTMYLIFGVDENFEFKTQTIKEIGKIEWVPIVDLPTWSKRRMPKPPTGGKPKKFLNVTTFVRGIENFLQRKGIDLNRSRQNQNRRRGRGGGAVGGRGSGQPGGRELKPFDFDEAPAPPGRELQPFSFEDGPKPAAAPAATAIDHLFAKFIQTDNAANAGGFPGSDSHAHDDKNDDDMLARLLGNIGTVSDVPPSNTPPAHAPSPLPPTNTKQSKLLQVLQQRPPQAPTPTSPPRTAHQSNLLAVLSSPAKPPAAPMPAHTPQAWVNEDEERAQLQRALLDTLLPAPASPAGAPVQSYGGSHGPSPHPHGPSPHVPSPMPQRWSPYPPSQASPYPPSQSSQPPQAAPPPPPPHTRPQPYDYAQPQAEPQPQPQSPARHVPQPSNDHQRSLLGTLVGKQQQAPNPGPAGPGQQAQPPNSVNYAQPPVPPRPPANYSLSQPSQPPHPNPYGQPNHADHAGQSAAPTSYAQPGSQHNANYGLAGPPPNANYPQPVQQPNASYHQTGQQPNNYAPPGQQPNAHYPQPGPAPQGQQGQQPNNFTPAQRGPPPPGFYGHQRQLSGGLPGQPGQGRPIGAAIGLPGQPGQPLAPPGWSLQQQFQFPNQGFPGQPGPPAPPQHPVNPPYQPYPAQPNAPQYPPQQQQYQQPQHAPQQLQQPQLQQHQPSPNPPPPRAAQTSPAMHQPVARPPVSGSLLGLASGR